MGRSASSVSGGSTTLAERIRRSSMTCCTGMTGLGMVKVFSIVAVPNARPRGSRSFRLASMKAAIQRIILLTLAAAAGAGAACGQAKSGLYGNLTLGVDGATATGVVSDARTGKGTE